jgi:hypothetical protein
MKNLKNVKFGDPVTNICAGVNNPSRHSYFVKIKHTKHKNKYGVVHKEKFARCTNKKGKFYDFDTEIIYPGHLSIEESKKLYDPIWAKKYGKE